MTNGYIGIVTDKKWSKAKRQAYSYLFHCTLRRLTWERHPETFEDAHKIADEEFTRHPKYGAHHA